MADEHSPTNWVPHYLEILKSDSVLRLLLSKHKAMGMIFLETHLNPRPVMLVFH